MNADSDLFVGLTRELLQRGCNVRFRATGTSMQPAIRDGEVVTVAPWSGDAFAVGEILLCCVGQRPMAHRVVAVQPSDHGSPVLYLHGDNLCARDRPVRASDVIGRVLTVSRDGSDHPLDGPRRLVRVRRVARRLSLRLQRLVRIAAGAARGIRQENRAVVRRPRRRRSTT